MDTIILACLFTQAYAIPTRSHVAPRAAVSPTLGSVSILANVTDPSVSRDSCGSALFGDRVLWTCRDTEVFDVSTGQATLPLVSNSASWTNQTSSGPAIQNNAPVGDASNGTNPVLLMYGDLDVSAPAFFPIQSDECPSAGVCSDGSRYAIWPNSPPLVTSTGSDGTVVGYTWIPISHLSGLTSLDPEPPYTLYKTSYTPSTDSNTLPSVSVVNEQFFSANTIGYGSYGGLVVDNIAYLYGQTDQGKGTVLANVSVNSIEDLSAYQYYVNGAWTSEQPGINDTSAAIANAGTGGQGTFYYDAYLQSYVWIGQAGIGAVADFYVSTAPDPWGPWIEPYLLWTAPNGDYAGIGSYTLQANPALKPTGDTSNGVYLTWTQQWNSTTYGGYITPLALLEWST